MSLIKACKCKCDVNTKNTISNEPIMFAVNIRKKKIDGNSKNKDNDQQIFVYVFSKNQTSPKKERTNKRTGEREWLT